MQHVTEEPVNISIRLCYDVHVDRQVTSWDKVASFVDNEMNVPT